MPDRDVVAKSEDAARRTPRLDPLALLVEGTPKEVDFELHVKNARRRNECDAEGTESARRDGPHVVERERRRVGLVENVEKRPFKAREIAEPWPRSRRPVGAEELLHPIADESNRRVPGRCAVR